MIGIRLLKIAVYQPSREPQLVIVNKGVLNVVDPEKICIFHKINNDQACHKRKEELPVILHVKRIIYSLEKSIAVYLSGICDYRHQLGYKRYSRQFEQGAYEQTYTQKDRLYLLCSREYVAYFLKYTHIKPISRTLRYTCRIEQLSRRIYYTVFPSTFKNEFLYWLSHTDRL